MDEFFHFSGPVLDSALGLQALQHVAHDVAPHLVEGHLTTMRFPSLTQLHAPLRHYRVRAGKIELLDGVVREPLVDEVDLLDSVGGATPKLRSRMELERVSLELRFGDKA